MRVLDLFSGIGGFALAAEWMNWQTVGFCEIDPYCRAVLSKHWPKIWKHDDIRTLTAELIRERTSGVDLICGGFPCTDISVAGRGEGLDGPASGLWWEMWRVIAATLPRWLCVENVPALRTRGADSLIASLEALGYIVWPLVVGAWSVGAPHRRNRVWLVGYLADAAIERSEGQRVEVRPLRQQGPHANGTGRGMADPGRERRERWSQDADQRRIQRARVLLAGRDAPIDQPTSESGSGRRMADTEQPRLEGLRADSGRASFSELGFYRAPARPRERQYEWEEPRLAYSESDRLERRAAREQSATRQTATRGSASDGMADTTKQSTRSARQSREGADTRAVESAVGASAYGVLLRLARRRRAALKAIGNSVVPQVVYQVFRAIEDADQAGK